MSRVLVIGDTHAPCMRDGYVEFLASIRDQWGCDRFVHIGDLVDNCALSFHLKKPHLKNPVEEYNKALEQLDKLWQEFPEADWLIGNHDALPYRWCEEVGIPESMMRSPTEIWDMQGWTAYPRWESIEIDGVLYQHGDRGRGGNTPALLNAQNEFKSVVQGHYHALAGVWYYANKQKCIFGMQTGCGIDHEHLAMAYGLKYVQKPIIGCGVIIDGHTAVFEPMIL